MACLVRMSTCNIAFWAWIVFAGGNIIYILITGHSFWQTRAEPLFAICGLLAGSLLRIRSTINALSNYDTAAARTKATIEAQGATPEGSLGEVGKWEVMGT